MRTQRTNQTIAHEAVVEPSRETTGTISRVDAQVYGAKPGFVIERHGKRADIPLAVSKTLLMEYARMIHRRVIDASGPDFDYHRHVDSFFAGLDEVLPPQGCYLLVRDTMGHVVGTAALRCATRDTGEMKHLYVRPDGRRSGLGETLIRARIDYAKALGLKWLIADTFKSNPELPPLYAKLGFQIVPPTGSRRSTTLSPEIEDLMWFYRYDLSA